MLFNRVTPTVSTQTLHFPPLQSGFQRLDIFDLQIPKSMLHKELPLPVFVSVEERLC